MQTPNMLIQMDKTAETDDTPFQKNVVVKQCQGPASCFLGGFVERI